MISSVFIKDEIYSVFIKDEIYSVFIKDEIYSVFIKVDDLKTLRAVMQDHRVMKLSPII